MKQRELDITHAHDSALIVASLHKTLDSLDASRDGQSQKITSLIDRVDRHLLQTRQSDYSTIWQIILVGLRVLRCHLRCQEVARGDSGDILSEREKLLVQCAEFRRQLSNFAGDSGWIERVFETDVQSINVEQLISFLRSTPIPLTYWRGRTENLPFRRPQPSNREVVASRTSLVRAIAFIDDMPLVSPQLLNPRLIYSLRFVVQGIGWHDESEELRLDLLTTHPSSDYSVSEFRLHKPSVIEDDQYKGELVGHIQFNTAQTLLSKNIPFVIQCAFELPNGIYEEIQVIGHNQLEFRIVDPEKHSFMSGRPRLDQHVDQLIHELVEESPSIRDELQDLIPVLEALTRLLGTYAQGAVFKHVTKIPERDFQADVLRDLRLILGQDVQEHPSQAGGYTDIYYRGVVIELKVEEGNGDRAYICQRYAQQPTQYVGVEARQVSVVLVLDLTPKREPTGDIRNDILLVEVPTHGGKDKDKKYASRAFVFVVNGNIENPSEYSKR